MPLDRQTIEKRDFPIARRGYEPAAVDAHLRSLSEEVETLQSSSRQRTHTLAAAASEQVRTIVEAAEQSAAEIQREAEQDGRRTRQDADRDAERLREEAGEQARELVARVSEAATAMLQRVDAMESELGSLLDSLRAGAHRLSADLTLLQGNVGELMGSEALGGGAIGAPSPEQTGEQETADAIAEPPAEELEEASAGSPADSDEGARLVALNMALDGSPREETDRYLAEHFTVADRAALLDEVYERVGG
ncbi:MAG TPA: hypothetical protein VHE14_06085 [Solirubrobacteraceae bacterium]|nr:hypothetical protein [Solirubrobacteraceae bacterium]